MQIEAETAQISGQALLCASVSEVTASQRGLDGLVAAEWGLRSRPAQSTALVSGFRLSGRRNRGSPFGALDSGIMAWREGDVKGKSVDSGQWAVASRCPLGSFRFHSSPLLGGSRGPRILGRPSQRAPEKAKSKLELAGAASRSRSFATRAERRGAERPGLARAYSASLRAGSARAHGLPSQSGGTRGGRASVRSCVPTRERRDESGVILAK